MDPSKKAAVSQQQNKWFSNMPGKSPARKVTIKGEDPESDMVGVMPIPPNHPKRSVISKTAITEPTHSDRSNLLQTVNSMVEKGLSQASGTEYEIKMHRLAVYKEAFSYLINEFNLYRPFLSQVKYEYDTVLADLGEDVRCVSDLKVEMLMKEREFATKLKAKEFSYRAELASRSTLIANAEAEVKKKDEEIGALRLRIETIEQKNTRLEREIGDLRKSCEMLTNSLTRADDEKRHFQNSDSSRQRELQVARLAVQKANEELERYEDLLSDCENHLGIFEQRHCVAGFEIC